MDDSVNKNFWKIPDRAIKKYASSFIGRPLVYHPSGQHIPYLKEGVKDDSPTFIDDILRVQERYKIGEIMYVNQQHIKGKPNEKGWYATIRVTDPEVVQKIRSGNISSFVSPQVYDVNGAAPNEETTEFIPLHIAVVSEPAYGNRARIKATCTGTGSSCVNALKSACGNNGGGGGNGQQQQEQQQQPCTCGCNGNVAASNIVTAASTNNHSSFLKNSSSETNSTMVNPIYRDPDEEQHQQQQQLIAQSGFNPYNQQQFLSQKTQTQEVDANGNLITKTEDRKPTATVSGTGNRSGKQQQQQQQGTEQQQQQQVSPAATGTSSSPVATGTGTLINTPVPFHSPSSSSSTDVQLQQQSPQQQQQNQNPVTGNVNPSVPNDILEAIKGMKTEYAGIMERLNQVEDFKKTAEDERMRQASEDQRKIIEAAFTPEIIADENARQDIIEKFVALPLNDDQLKMILDLILSGTFSSSSQQQPPSQAKAATTASPPRRPGFGGGGNVKGASVMNTLSISKPRGTDPFRGASAISLNSRLFGDINVENL